MGPMCSICGQPSTTTHVCSGSVPITMTVPSKPTHQARPADRFHRHLDECRQCRNSAFNLCAVGIKLLWDVGRNL